MKKIMVLTLSFLLYSTLSFAVITEEIDLSEHGKDLTRASFPARHYFYNKFHKDWIYSTYAERRYCLIDWHKKLIEQERKKQFQAKQEALERKAREREKKQALKIENARIKDLEKERKNQEREDNTRSKGFARSVKSEQKMITDLRKSDQ